MYPPQKKTHITLVHVKESAHIKQPQKVLSVIIFSIAIMQK